MDAQGRVRMVDVGAKPPTRRRAVARARVVMRAETLRQIRAGRLGKGDALAVARVAGILAAKRTAELIPLCHPVPVTAVDIDFHWPAEDAAGATFLEVEAAVETVDRTGVEMEALVAVTTACLTLYDMCKAIDQGITIEAVRLVEKRGGRSDRGPRGEDAAGGSGGGGRDAPRALGWEAGE